MLTHYGKFIRHFRIELEMRLIDIVNELSLSASYLSMIACGKEEMMPLSSLQ